MSNGRYFYHGTTADRLSFIMKYGLFPSMDSSNVKFSVSYPETSNPTKIYFTDNPRAAFEWAQTIRDDEETEERYFSNPVVLRIPESVLNMNFLEPDHNICDDEEFEGRCQEYEYEGNVLPKDIQFSRVMIDSKIKPNSSKVSGWTSISKFNPDEMVAFTKIRPYRPVNISPDVMFQRHGYVAQAEVYGNRNAIQRAMKFKGV